jgi:hypothetical protein
MAPQTDGVACECGEVGDPRAEAMDRSWFATDRLDLFSRGLRRAASDGLACAIGELRCAGRPAEAAEQDGGHHNQQSAMSEPAIRRHPEAGLGHKRARRGGNQSLIREEVFRTRGDFTVLQRKLS